MEGTGLPLVTPFGDDAVDHEALQELVEWVEASGVDFIVPCGSNSEAPLMSAEERERVIETVCDAASVPVMAGTGHSGLPQTKRSTERAAEAGADAALVVTPYYFNHDQATLAAYYEDLADASPLPIYLYSVPAYTGTSLEPETVARLAVHENVCGIKDSSGDLVTFQRIRSRTAAGGFSLLVGNGAIYAHALDAGGDGGVLALANVVPELASEICDRHADGDHAAARALNRDLLELNHAVTIRYGVPGLKAAMRARDVPAGDVRRPHRPVGGEARLDLEELVDEALTAGETDGDPPAE